MAVPGKEGNQGYPVDEEEVQSKLKQARVARLGTADAAGHPHVVPVCFAYNGRVFYTALDSKRKRVAPERLARVRHIQGQPKVTLLIDEYQEEWERLWYIQVRGTASLLSASEEKEHGEAQQLLTEKYPQYAAGLLPEGAPLIRIVPKQILSWASTKGH